MNLNEKPKLTKQEVKSWVSMVRDLKLLRAQEMVLRKKIAARITFNQTENSVTEELFGYELKAERKFTYSLDAKEYAQVADLLSEKERNAVTLKPTLSVGKYNKLSRGTLCSLVTIKPAAPAVSVLSTLE